MLPLQTGFPGGPDLFVVFLAFVSLVVIPAAVGYWVGRDAKTRGSDHHLA